MIDKDGIVEKRRALFMADLKNEIEKREFKVEPVNTESIKITKKGDTE